MTEIFKSFEKDFLELLINIRKIIAKNESESISGLKSDLNQAEKFLKQMEIEVSMMPISTKGPLLAKAKRYRKEWQELDSRVRSDNRAQIDKQNSEILMGFPATFDFGQDKKLADSQSLFLDQGARLENGKRVALETEGIAIDTMNVLKGQRDQIGKSTTGAREISRDLGQSNNLMNIMQRRSIANKLILAGVVAFLIITIGVVFYEKIVKNKQK